MEYEYTFEFLETLIEPRMDAGDLELVRRAYGVAEVAHRGQKRDEGLPYIVHPVRVAVTLPRDLDIYDSTLICSALLHDVIEDSPATREDIADEFGEEIARIVWLLTKLKEVSLADYLANIEAARGTGAATVKLCDRLDNLRFVECSPRHEKKRRYILTTEKYYLPMAARTNKYLYDELERALNHLRKLVES